MLKKLGPYARPYAKWIALGVLCSAAEAIFELLIPLVMSDIVDIGIANGGSGLYPAQGRADGGHGHGVPVLRPGQRRLLVRGRTGLRRESARGRSTSIFRTSPFPTLRSFPPPLW